MTSGPEQMHAIVHGRVQGVNFRYYTALTANELELTGWVRNLPEGTVEVSAEGPRARLEKLVLFLYRGPSSAYVTDVDIEWLSATGDYDGFRVR